MSVENQEETVRRRGLGWWMRRLFYSPLPSVIVMVIFYLYVGYITSYFYRDEIVSEAYAFADDMGNDNDVRDEGDLAIIVSGVGYDEGCTLEEIWSRDIRMWVRKMGKEMRRKKREAGEE